MKKSSKILAVCLIIMTVALAVLGLYIYRSLEEQRLEALAEQARLEYELALKAEEERRRQEEMNKSPEPSPIPSPSPSPSPEPTPKEVRPEFLELITEYNNEDIIGYLKIEGTTIDYPVVKSVDNKDYLNRDYRKNPSSAGTIFMDYENDVAKNDKNVILYGHNMNADIMFHSLRNYRDEEFFKEHPVVEFNTLYDNQKWEVFSFYKTRIDFFYNKVQFKDDDDFFGLAQEMKKRSIYDTGVEVYKTDRILTLSTCSNIEEDTRYVLNCRLVETTDENAPSPRAASPSAE